jgi:hypothetical protein
MGWSVLNKPPAEGWQAFLDKTLSGGVDVNYKVRASAIGPDGNYYAAIERPAGNGLKRCVYAAIVLIEGAGWKVMSEQEGPYYWAAPRAVTDKLEPTTNPYALRWRERVADEQLAAGVVS